LFLNSKYNCRLIQYHTQSHTLSGLERE